MTHLLILAHFMALFIIVRLHFRGHGLTMEIETIGLFYIPPFLEGISNDMPK